MDYESIIREIWPEWRVVKLLGAGSYGRVYHCERTDIAGTSQAAIKLVVIPRDEAELKSLQMEGFTQTEIQDYLKKLAEDLSNEVRLMDAMKGNTNIVSIEDHQVVYNPDIPQWYIIIRMELLTPLQRHLEEKKMTEAEIIKLGLDLCSALTLCRQRSIVHRDIKPENIFVSAFGDYKLGDFGVARSMERLTSSFTRTGTYFYMAPELFNNTLTDMSVDAAAKVDIYSLGMVLYVLSNNGRIAFLPSTGTPSPEARSQALMRRMHGDPLEPPAHASKGLAKIIIKACAFKPKDRFASAEEMRAELLKLQQGKPIHIPTPRPLPLPTPPRPNLPIWAKLMGGLVGAALVMALVMFLTQPKEPSEDPFTFTDPAVEAAARGALNRPKDPVYPSDLAGLKALDLSGQNLTDIRDLSAFTGLESLDLSGNDLSDVSALSSLSGLKALDLSGNEVKNVSPLSKLSALESLNLLDNPAEDLSPVTFVPALITPAPTTVAPTPTPSPAPELYTFASSIIEGGARKVLNIPTGALTKADLAKVTELDLSGRHLTDIADLAAFTGLESLNLSGNAIEDISPLSKLTTLKTLNLSGNRVSDIQPLARLFELETLELDGNAISNVTPLAGLYQLKRLNLDGNAVEDYSPVRFVSELITPSPTPVITPTPSPEPTPTPPPVIIAVVPFGESYDFEAQIGPDGAARTSTDIEDYETLSLSLTMKESLLPDDFAQRWSVNYKLQGNEAGAGFELTLRDYDGSAVIIPQNIMTITLQSEFGDLELEGFQLTDAPIGGDIDASVASGETVELWKRYNSEEGQEPMTFLAVTVWNDGARQTILFKLAEDAQPYAFANAAVETAVRAQLGDGELYAEDLEAVTELDLSAYFVDDLSDLAMLTNLESLTVYKTGSDSEIPEDWTGETVTLDLSPLSGLSRLQRLVVQGASSDGNEQLYDIDDISPLEGLTQLTSLTLTDGNFSDISPLQGMTQLTELRLDNNGISDITPLEGMTQLTELYLNNNIISDISPLAGMTQLSNLGLYSNSILDLTPLQNLSQLNWLSLNHNNVDDLTPLEDLTQLTELRLANNFISDPSPLTNLTQLSILDLSGNKIRQADLEQLSFVPVLTADDQQPEIVVHAFASAAVEAAVRAQLGISSGDITEDDLLAVTALDFSSSFVDDLSDLAAMPNLETLSLTSDDWTAPAPENWTGETVALDLSPLKGLSKLQRLTILGMVNGRQSQLYQIDDISPLSDLTALELLDLRYNSITDLSPLKDLPGLSVLYLSRNSIADLSPLEGLTSLQILDLGGNGASDLSPLKGLTSLTHLYLSANDISDVSALGNLKALEELYLNVNSISDPSPLEGLTNLQILDLRDNRISDAALSRLSFVPSLYGSDQQPEAAADTATPKEPQRSGGSVSAESPSPAEAADDDAADAHVFASAAIEAVVRQAVGKSEGAILPRDLESITELNLGVYYVDDISDLAAMPNLETLNLGANALTDFTPMAGLSKLRSYSGPSIPWPTSKQAVVLGIWPDTMPDRDALKSAFEAAFADMGVNKAGSTAVSKAQSADFVLGLVDGTTNIGEPLDALCLIPEDGVDYSEAVAQAMVHGVALRMMSAEDDAALYSEICALYGVEGSYAAESTVPWPTDPDALVVTLYTESAYDNADVQSAVELATASAGRTGAIGRIRAEAEMSQAYLDYVVSADSADTRDIRGVYLFPAPGVNYNAAIAKANANGIAVHIFDTENPASVYDDICALLGVSNAGNPF